MSALAEPGKAVARLPRLAAWGGLVAFETLAQAAMKAGGASLAGLPFGRAFLAAAVREPLVLLGAAGYLLSFAAWMVILDRMPLSRGFPMSSIVTLAILAASVLVFGEVLDGWRLCGVALILGGLALMGDEGG